MYSDFTANIWASLSRIAYIWVAAPFEYSNKNLPTASLCKILETPFDYFQFSTSTTTLFNDFSDRQQYFFLLLSHTKPAYIKILKRPWSQFVSVRKVDVQIKCLKWRRIQRIPIFKPLKFFPHKVQELKS